MYKCSLAVSHSTATTTPKTMTIDRPRPLFDCSAADSPCPLTLAHPRTSRNRVKLWIGIAVMHIVGVFLYCMDISMVDDDDPWNGSTYVAESIAPRLIVKSLRIFKMESLNSCQPSLNVQSSS